MYEDKHFVRFMSYLNIFTGFMFILVTSNDLLLLFFGWEGVGLMSYLLINFWFTRVAAVQASFKAFVVNKIGDICLLFAIVTFFYYLHSLDLEIIFSCSQYLPENARSVITAFILFGVMSKSAQIGLHTWLADAMEGPTPVSALLHAATMVTAGVFLLIRLSPFFILDLHSSFIFSILAFIGALTTIFAASSGLVQNDFKKVIAYSTASQLGYMVLACGLYNFDMSFFHLINHAYFKALLFLSSGVLIHSFFNDQDLRKFGGLLSYSPFLYLLFLVASFSLAGFPFLSGFYSKDLILETTFLFSSFSYAFKSSFLFWIAILTVSLTSFYSFRLIYFLFLSPPSSLTSSSMATFSSSYKHLKPFSLYFLLFPPLFILALFSIFFGYLTLDFFVGFGSPYLLSLISLDFEFIPTTYLLLPLIMSFFGFFFSFLFYFFSISLFTYPFSPLSSAIYSFLSYKWYFDYFFNSFSFFILYYSYLFPFKSFDRGFLELFGSFGFHSFTSRISSSFSSFHSGYIFKFTLFFWISLFFLLFFMFLLPFLQNGVILSTLPLFMLFWYITILI